jgi:hypothetical protein
MMQTIVSQHEAVLYLAVEGSLLTLHVHPEPDCSFIVDLQSLGAAAFDAGSGASEAKAEAGQGKTDGRGGFSSDEQRNQDEPPPSLREILESPYRKKVLFDARRPSNFLAHRFGVTLRSVENIKSLYNNTESARPRSLRSCLE